MAINNTHFSSGEINNIFTKAKRIFFIGIGGISMSALATYSAFCGKEIYGYDKARTDITKRLEKIGKIKYYSTPDNITGMDMVVYTNAIDESNFEYRRAKKLKLPLISRANLLGYFISLHKNQIGISGCHGKSTTTAMLAQIFEYACLQPTIFCGAEMKEFCSPSKFGKRDFCIFEACEYKNSFLSLPSTDAGILNIDSDHLDFFSSLEEIQSSFNKYVKNAHRVFLNIDDKNSKCITHKNIITYGFNKNAIYRGEILTDKMSGSGQKSNFLVYKSNVLLARCTLNLIGKHFIYDALCAFAIAHSNDIAPNVIAKALEDFRGSSRRMEFIKKSHTGADIFLDYAHHPSEISASLNALFEAGYSSVLCVFQPHTYSRTFYLYDRFVESLKIASQLIVAPVFPAREVNIYELNEKDFATDAGGSLACNIGEIADTINTTSCSCVVLMGAGDIGEKLLKLIE